MEIILIIHYEDFLHPNQQQHSLLEAGAKAMKGLCLLCSTYTHQNQYAQFEEHLT